MQVDNFSDDDLAKMKNECELREHEKKDHRGKCPGCEKAYVSSEELLEHCEKGHGLKLFQCEECGKYFQAKEELKVHEKEEHEITSEEGSKEEEKKSVSNEEENEENSEIESLKRELMLLSEEYEKLFRTHEDYKEEVKERVGKLEKDYIEKKYEKIK